MKKISLIIADQDATYVESFARYIRNSEFASRFDVKLFSQQERLAQLLASGEHFNVLLCSPELLTLPKEEKLIDSIIQLKEEMEEDIAYPQIRKYQPLGNILSEVLQVHYERGGKKEKKQMSDGGTEVISVFAASGGTGKTTVAFNLAREMADQEATVLYLNLELINSTPLLFDVTNKESSSALLYYVKTNVEQLAAKIEEMSITDSETNIDYFHLVPSAEEMKELTGEELEQLISALVNINKYNYIVIDLDSALDERSLTALKLSNHVCWLLNNDSYSFHKTSHLLEELHAFLNDASFSDRVSLVLNRYTGKVNTKLEDYELDIVAYLPYVPQWKEVVRREQISSIPIFNQYIRELYQHVIEARGVLHDG